ncbi:S49 family peptidase [Tropicimonas sp. IMCC34011]|uniref:S49 family peptidase n=1 Tax=Tropicimonas sp. IMCC34011 TaxID=2248759 RepID=UPI000E2706FB|nr:S49 family peptidase [Tropicimonas sp. IMCC34011]
MALPPPFGPKKPTVSVVRLTGMIAANARGLNDATVAPLLERAFRRKPKAVAISINSPGGSPVQSSLIGARIRRLSEEKEIPVIAFIEDAAASGGYWLAAAADEIFVDPSSIVGSIGVISSSFGFQEFIDRHGVERRIHTSVGSKSFLDPFRPEKEEDVERLRRLQDEIHEAFTAHVVARRGARLTSDEDLFTGEFWTGKRAVELGLADGVGHLVPEMKRRFGDKVRFNVQAPKRSLFRRIGLGAATELLSAAGDHVEERAQWARLGL